MFDFGPDKDQEARAKELHEKIITWDMLTESTVLDQNWTNMSSPGGMYESNHQDQFMKYLMENGDVDSAISDVVNTAKNLIANNSDIGGFVVECTDLTPFSKAIKTATGLPVFDPVDLLRRVHEQVK